MDLFRGELAVTRGPLTGPVYALRAGAALVAGALPVPYGEELDGVGDEMLERAPVDGVASEGSHGVCFPRQVLDEVPQASPRQSAGAEVEDVDAVEAEEVGLDGLAVPAQELDEAADSPSGTLRYSP